MVLPNGDPRGALSVRRRAATLRGALRPGRCLQRGPVSKSSIYDRNVAPAVFVACTHFFHGIGPSKAGRPA